MTGMLDIEVTRRCNLRCDYCFVGWSRDWTSDMPLEVALEVIKEGKGLFSTLHLTGGEAFVYQDIFTLIEEGVRQGYQEILINTNGTLLTPSLVKRLAKFGSRLAFSISLDGPEDIHDAARGKGSFQKASNGLRMLLDANMKVTAMTVITPEVLKILGRFLNYLHTSYQRLQGITLFPVGVGKEGSQKPGVTLRALFPNELVRLALLTALSYRAGFSVGIGAYPIVNPLLLAFGYPKERLYQCTAGRGRICVHADLSVSSCHPVKEAIYGTWHTGLLHELSGFSAHHTLKQRDFDGCRSCEHQETCGHCRAFVTSSGHDLFGNDEICHEVLGARKQSLQIAL